MKFTEREVSVERARARSGWRCPHLDGRPGRAPADRAGRVDAVFAKYNPATPGCAVGVAEHGKPALTKGYGSADLEHDVRITPDTIFEAGSVSKQFTAASILLLARDGRLSIDDPARKYIPELPDYGKPLTIRHMLNHTSGLRDWGSVAAIGGWPRGTRVHTHANVLEIVSRQESLNFPPGTRWSYTNTGFNLAAIIVERVSGKSFQDFTHERLFAPLGMTQTSWRDDYTRIVKGRAIAYDEQGDEFRHRHAVRERLRQRRDSDHCRRSAEVERELHEARCRRRGVRCAPAAAGTVQRRPGARLRVRPDDRAS